MENKPLSWIIDVGAFHGKVGNFLRAERKKPDCHVLFIEPDFDAFQKIEIQPGDIKLNIAIASHDGEIDFNFYQPGTHSVLKINKEGIRHYIDGFSGKPALESDWQIKKVERIPCSRLDSICNKLNINQIDCLKTDCQGFDLQAIKSLGEKIKNVDEIICEVQVTPKPVYSGAGSDRDIIDFLHSEGFLYVRRQYQSYGQEINMYFKHKRLFNNLDQEPTVSLLTTYTNSAPLLERCTKSIANQEYPFVEHIIEDTPGTLNNILRRSRGDIIGIANAENEYLPNAASVAMEFFGRHPEIGVVYGRQQNIDTKNNIIFETVGPSDCRFEKILCCEHIIPSCTAFVRRSAFETAGFYIDTLHPTCFDYEMWVRLSQHCRLTYLADLASKFPLRNYSIERKKEIVNQLTQSKIEIIRKICNSKKMFWKAFFLERTAKAGVYRWSATYFLPPLANGEEIFAFSQFRKSLLIVPNLKLLFIYFRLYFNKKFPINFHDLFDNCYSNFKSTSQKIIVQVRGIARKIDALLFGQWFYKNVYSRLRFMTSKHKNHSSEKQ